MLFSSNQPLFLLLYFSGNVVDTWPLLDKKLRGKTELPLQIVRFIFKATRVLGKKL